MAVVTQRCGDVADRKLGDVDRQRLVEPEVRLGPEAEQDSDRDGYADGDPGGDDPAVSRGSGGVSLRLGGGRRGLGVRDRHGAQR